MAVTVWIIRLRQIEIAEKRDDVVVSDLTGAPTDPSVGDLPKESGQDHPIKPIDEERRD